LISNKVTGFWYPQINHNICTRCEKCTKVCPNIKKRGIDNNKFEQVAYAVQNMIANLTGMICDGAKPSCALKVTTGVSTAVLSAIMAMENRCVTSVEGIIDEDVDQSIRNLTKIGSKGMNETDKLVLEIMTSK
jgi:L-cysteine desulfidase